VNVKFGSEVKRDARIELFRVFLMLDICVYHVLVNCGSSAPWLLHILLVGVVGLSSLAVGLVSSFLGLGC